MKFFKAFKQALNMVLHSKLRSWLTILGIVIGVAAVISIVSMGQALSADMSSQLGDLGGDILTLSPGAAKASSFTGGGRKSDTSTATSSDEEIVLDKSDVQALKVVSDIKVMNTQISGRADAYFVAESGSTTITGVDQATWFQVTTSTIAVGRMLGPADSNVIVVGGRIADGFFDKKIGINQMLTIEDRLFRIVGILDDMSSTIYMPLQIAFDVLEKDKDVYDSIIIQVKDEEQLDLAMANIEQKLMLVRHVTESNKDFSLTSNQAAQDARADMMKSLTVFLTAIAAVALLVGAVGVANTMFTSVLEKTKEIGIMKAIGARNNDILKIFLMNSALIGFIGGVLGLLLGMLLSGFLPALLGDSGGIMSRMASGGSMVSWQSVLLAIGMSVAIGMISGAIPAYQASKLKPVEALRYE